MGSYENMMYCHKCKVKFVFSIVYSSDPAADDIHDDAIVLPAAVISGVNSIPAFAGIHTVLSVLLLLLFLLLHEFLLL